MCGFHTHTYTYKHSCINISVQVSVYVRACVYFEKEGKKTAFSSIHKSAETNMGWASKRSGFWASSTNTLGSLTSSVFNRVSYLLPFNVGFERPVPEAPAEHRMFFFPGKNNEWRALFPEPFWKFWFSEDLNSQVLWRDFLLICSALCLIHNED